MAGLPIPSQDPIWLSHVLLHPLPSSSGPGAGWVLKGQVSIWPHRTWLEPACFLSLVSVARGPALSLAKAWITKATAY